MRDYIAIVHKDPNSDYGVSFPDFPGCITAGSTMEEARAMALEVLEGHTKVMAEYGETIPGPMTFEQVMSHTFSEGAVAFLVVSLPEEATKAVRLNISLPGQVLDRIDRYAKTHHLSRSAFLAQAAQQAMR